MQRIYSGLLLFLILVGLAFADQSITGTQTRGRGTDAKLRSTSAALPNGGVIVNVVCGPAGFWLESSQGKVVRFSGAAKAVGSSLPAGTWSVYPNLNPNQDQASVSVDIKSGPVGQVILVVTHSEDPVISAKVKSIIRSLATIVGPKAHNKVFIYDFANPHERLYCEKTLGIGSEVLPFLGVTECRNGVPRRISFRVNSSASADLAARQILDFLPKPPSVPQSCCSVPANSCREMGCNCRAFTCATPQLHGSLHGKEAGDGSWETCASLNCTCVCGHLFEAKFVPPPNYDPTEIVDPRNLKVGGHSEPFSKEGRRR